MDGVKVMAIGYKYNSKKVLHFVAPEGAGSCEPGFEYQTKFTDAAGNVCTRGVIRPAVISRYYGLSPKCDNHNQGRQHELRLEEIWVTTDCWFRLACTIIGITTYDCLLAMRASSPDSSQFKRMSTVDFTDMMSYQMIHNSLPGHELGPARTALAAAEVTEQDPQAGTAFPGRHRPVKYGPRSAYRALKEGEADTPERRRCVVCALDTTTYPRGTKTMFHCGAGGCGEKVALCSDTTGRPCMESHIYMCEIRARPLGGGESNKRRNTLS